MKKFLSIILLTVLNIHNVLASPENKITVTPVVITTADFYQRYTAIGQAKLSNSKDYYAKIAGKVDFILDNQGVAVGKNEVIIAIDRDIAEKMKTQAEANLYLARSNYERDALLFKKKISSEEGVNKSKAALEQAKSEYTKALNAYNDMVIKAPEAGYVGVVKASVGEEVKVGDYLFSLTTKSDFYVFVDLPEIMHGKVFTTDSVNIKNERKTNIEGKIVAISDYVSNNGTITAKLEFPYSEEILHGSYIEAQIVFDKHAALALPEKAVLKNSQGDFVYLITPEHKVKQVFVKLGVRTDNRIEVLSGDLKEGDMIVYEGLTKVYDGAWVQIKNLK